MPGIIPVIGNVALLEAASTSPRAWGARTEGLAELPCDQSGTQAGCRSGDEGRLSASSRRRETRFSIDRLVDWTAGEVPAILDAVSDCVCSFGVYCRARRRRYLCSVQNQGAKPYMASGSGATSCGDWTAIRRSGGNREREYSACVLHFVSGAGWAGERMAR
jgi:hypothetical protein